ncbi:MAG: saccharopine dehydrogenase NADP-binding domain-containing protein [Neomegalonema sp.]|nr:saccharopine dehydrogenase NADP-binding domain-containing protein [Neomegalonema sp.]
MEKIAVLGLGKVGALAALLLDEAGHHVIGVDSHPPQETLPFSVELADMQNADALADIAGRVNAILSCLPYQLNLPVAKAAHTAGAHYFDLTEDVPTTKAIQKLSETSAGLMAPQCGLAPGFVGIVGAAQIARFAHCRACRMRVGALPQNPTGLMGYAFNWSPEGVVNEYLNDCEVIEGGERKWVSPMEWHETLYIDGVQLEAFTTSGGLGAMCDAYLGKVDNMDYKSLRYPGHMKLMNFFFHELLMRDQRQVAGEILVNAKPPVKDDVVFIHVSSEGWIDGRLTREEFVRAYRPRELAGAQRTAIAWTTSASVAAIIEMAANGALPRQGFLRQEEVPLEAFLNTRSGALYRDI